MAASGQTTGAQKVEGRWEPERRGTRRVVIAQFGPDRIWPKPNLAKLCFLDRIWPERTCLDQMCSCVCWMCSSVSWLVVCKILWCVQHFGVLISCFLPLWGLLVELRCRGAVQGERGRSRGKGGPGVQVQILNTPQNLLQQNNRTPLAESRAELVQARMADAALTQSGAGLKTVTTVPDPRTPYIHQQAPIQGPSFRAVFHKTKENNNNREKEKIMTKATTENSVLQVLEC